MLELNDGTKRSLADRWLEALGLMGLAGLVFFVLEKSWRKWPDPLIDFGRQLYFPWRLANGSVLYRDLEYFYGPLSQYLNAEIFKLFGPSLMVLVAANLIVFAAIIAAIYYLFRRAWGAGAALLAAAVFVAVFGFSQFTIVSGYNYAAPYAHEATHGLLVCLLLVIVLIHWIEQMALVRSFLAGGLFGLTLLLKAEYILAGGLVTFVAVAIQLWRRRPPAVGVGIAWLVGALLPTAGFTVFFAQYYPWMGALRVTSQAWLIAFSTTQLPEGVIQTRFLGLDRPWPHLLEHGTATLLASLLIGALCATARMVDRIGSHSLRILLCGLVAGGVGWLALAGIAWINIGTCLLGLTLIYLLDGVRFLLRGPQSGVGASQGYSRLMIAALAAALMARMLLNGRIYQYGFYQAALAAILIPAVWIGELPVRVGAGRWGARLIVACGLILVGSAATLLTARSQKILGLKVASVGKGSDMFYAFEPTGKLVAFLCEKVEQMPRVETLLVLPGAEMINYLTRRPCPVATSNFSKHPTGGGFEEGIVLSLQQHPPDAVIVVSHDLSGYGIARYGERPGEGQQIMRWMHANYRLVSSMGGDPLDSRQLAGQILTRRN